MDYSTIYGRILAFRDARDWAIFHDPKNLSEAITIEAAELIEVFLWKTTGESRRLDEVELARVREELADIFIFLIYLSDVLGIDLLQAVTEKIRINESKYPAKKSKGTRKKYDKL